MSNLGRTGLLRWIGDVAGEAVGRVEDLRDGVLYLQVKRVLLARSTSDSERAYAMQVLAKLFPAEVDMQKVVARANSSRGSLLASRLCCFQCILLQAWTSTIVSCTASRGSMRGCDGMPTSYPR